MRGGHHQRPTSAEDIDHRDAENRPVSGVGARAHLVEQYQCGRLKRFEHAFEPQDVSGEGAQLLLQRLEPGRKFGEDDWVMIVGDKGKLLGPSHAGAPRLIPESRQKEYGRPPKTLPRSPGHHREWIEACKAGKPADARSGFWYAGPFVEALLVGNLAVRLQKRVEWDSARMRSPNCPEADNYVTKFYRAGFDLV